jgi:hypothetical protein
MFHSAKGARAAEHPKPAMRAALLAALLVLSACGKTEQADSDKKDDAGNAPGVALSAEQVKSLGIVTEAARATTYQQEVAGYGVVTALDTIAQSDADFATASAAAGQSEAAAARARLLATGEEAAVSREVVEQADAKAAADRAALALARRKREAVFGPKAPFGADRGALMADLSAGRAVLVRVTFPLGSIGGGLPRTLRIARLGDKSRSWRADRVWEAPADPNLPGRGFYAVIRGSDLAQNEHVDAFVPKGAPAQGVEVPGAALLFGESQSWVYLENQPDHFVRVPIDISRPMDEGYFVQNGVSPGQKVVTSGAGLILSREINPATTAED